jgi:hypothetical protein
MAFGVINAVTLITFQITLMLAAIARREHPYQPSVSETVSPRISRLCFLGNLAKPRKNLNLPPLLAVLFLCADCRLSPTWRR